MLEEELNSNLLSLEICLATVGFQKSFLQISSKGLKR